MSRTRSPGIVSRRKLMTGAALAGIGLAGAVPLAQSAERGIQNPSLCGPHLDLTSVRDGVIGRARLEGNVDLTGARYGWFDGSIMALAPSGEFRRLCGIRGFSVTRLLRHPQAQGWRKLHREVGCHYSQETGQRMQSMINPFTGAHVAVPDVGLEWAEDLSPLSGSAVSHHQWRVDRGQLLFESAQRVVAHKVLAPTLGPRERSAERVRFSHSALHVASLVDMQNDALAMVPAVGTWTRATAWPAWLQMGESPGRCLIQCMFGGGVAQAEGLPEAVLSCARSHHEQWLQPPEISGADRPV